MRHLLSTITLFCLFQRSSYFQVTLAHSPGFLFHSKPHLHVYIHMDGPGWTGCFLTSSPPMPFTSSLLITHTMDRPHHLPSHKLFLNLKLDWLTLAAPLPAPQPSHSLSPTLPLLMLISLFQAISPFLASHSSPGSLDKLIHPSFTLLIFTPILLVKPSPGFH